MTTRKGLATAGGVILTIGVAVLAIPLTTLESLNVVSAVGGAVVLAGLVVLVVALFRPSSPRVAPAPPVAQQRSALRAKLRELKDELADADTRLERNEIERQRSASFSDGAAHLYASIESGLKADRDKIAGRISDLERDLAELEAP
ncbi:hypothetical protein ACFC1I_19090 [Microbacterium sp. NPDC056044]|uniref:hypothetical protein n=1 Tax=Microbacterium sp. NPDC056044 TaxID=3345690 RepID=UPI0035DAAF78